MIKSFKPSIPLPQPQLLKTNIIDIDNMIGGGFNCGSINFIINNTQFSILQMICKGVDQYYKIDGKNSENSIATAEINNGKAIYSQGLKISRITSYLAHIRRYKKEETTFIEGTADQFVKELDEIKNMLTQKDKIIQFNQSSKDQMIAGFTRFPHEGLATKIL